MKFVFEKDKISVKDRAWCIPPTGKPSDYCFPGFGASEFFGNDLPLHIEYCSGNGDWIASRAKQHPEFNCVAIERKYERATQILAKIHQQELSNLMLICGEGLQVTSHYFPDNSIAAIYINFPDPWPKRHHARHRLVAPLFVEQLARCLEADGKVTLVTDDASYSTAMIAHFKRHTAFESLFPQPHYVHEWEGYGNSHFEQLWRKRGCDIRYHLFRRATR